MSNAAHPSRRTFVGGLAAGLLSGACASERPARGAAEPAPPAEAGDPPRDAAARREGSSRAEDAGRAEQDAASSRGAGPDRSRDSLADDDLLDAGRIEGPSDPADAAGGARDGAPIDASAVIDTHVHFWDLSRSPPFHNGRNAMPPEYATLAKAAGVTGCVLVEGAWGSSLAWNQWGLELAARSEIVVAVIGSSPSFVETLAKNRLFRGVRVGTRSIGDPALEVLADKGLAVDVNVAVSSGANDVLVVAERARAMSELKVVIDHAGYMPYTDAPTPAWVRAWEAAARTPNVYCKVSRNAAPGPGLDLLWRTMGEDRLLFGSNWPLNAVGGQVTAMRSYLRSKGTQASQKFFSGNARTVYGWIPR
jgi:predicted TIM-barrel fold metal-dependent hydrolase